MKLNEQPLLPANPDTDFGQRLVQRLYELQSATARKVNALASGRIFGADETGSAAPAAGLYQRGDIVRNSAIVELGGAGSKYVVTGWVCTVEGTPGTWVQMRSLTGN